MKQKRDFKGRFVKNINRPLHLNYERGLYAERMWINYLVDVVNDLNKRVDELEKPPTAWIGSPWISPNLTWTTSVASSFSSEKLKDKIVEYLLKVEDISDDMARLMGNEIMKIIEEKT